MLVTMRALVAHKGYAGAVLLNAVPQNASASGAPRLAASPLSVGVEERGQRRGVFGAACAVLSLTISGCVCPPSIDSSSMSPDGRLEAVTYSTSCGAMAPFNHRVGLKNSGSNSINDVLTILEIGWTARPTWRSEKALQITFDCLSEAHCRGRDDRHWTVNAKTRWRDVAITYDITTRLRQGLTPADLEKLPLHTK